MLLFLPPSPSPTMEANNLLGTGHGVLNYLFSICNALPPCVACSAAGQVIPVANEHLPRFLPPCGLA